ncbi:hypothetical protein P4640_12130 [Priestia aryabhattai]|uniref:serine O-acetyltransferase n=1 Tax=Priestia aryabhattai TaxID=412384 RepID=UPI002E1AF94A|nr:hypothetical protein [Priestia aryabhattai]
MKHIKLDFKRNNKNPITLSALITYRTGNWIYYRCNIPIIKQFFWFLYLLADVVFVRIIGGGELPAKTKIDCGLKLPHGVNGIIVHPDAVIGKNVTIMHQVTLGSVHTNGNVPPYIGDEVFIGAGAKIIGNITVGNKARIGTNAVVIKDVTEQATAVGNPARNILKHTS